MEYTDYNYSKDREHFARLYTAYHRMTIETKQEIYLIYMDSARNFRQRNPVTKELIYPLDSNFFFATKEDLQNGGLKHFSIVTNPETLYKNYNYWGSNMESYLFDLCTKYSIYILRKMKELI